MNHDHRYKSERELRQIKEDAGRYWMHQDPRVRWAKDDEIRDVDDELRRRRVQAQSEEDEGCTGAGTRRSYWHHTSSFRGIENDR